jgi:hypothetical protein
LHEAVLLGHALAQRLSEDTGCRILAIKGPVLSAQGLRHSTQSADVDVWIEPSRWRAFCASLGALGWAPTLPDTGPHIVPQHSTAFRHPLWPCEIDVHAHFPGFLADSTAVFNALWARRTTMEMAAQKVTCSDLVGSAAIAGLHLLRDPAQRKDEIAQFRARLGSLLTAVEVAELTSLAIDTGAGETLEPILSALGVTDLQRTASPADLRRWRLRTTAESTPSVPWVYALTTLPLRRWPGTLWHAVWLTEAEVRFWWPDYPAGWRGLLRARLARLRDGIRHLPAAIRLVWRTRKEP